MLVSMTGFGQGEASNKSSRVMVEIRTVNHRYLDLSIKLPKVLSHREHELKDLVKDKLQRGRISITVSAEIDQPAYAVKINVPLMEQYVAHLQGFAKKHGLESNLDINTLASLPEVFHLHEDSRGDDELWPLLKKGLKDAVGQCMKMRTEEGAALEKDLRLRIDKITAVIAKVEKRAPKVIAQHKKALKDRLATVMNGGRLDRDRWMTEVALLADRLDFTEEIIRLKSHMAQLTACLDKGGAVSKKLTYLLQEVHREATTIGSKASDSEVIEYVIQMKEESERLREQVQNLE